MGQVGGVDYQEYADIARVVGLGSMDTELLANHFYVDAADWPDGAGRLATVEALFGELVRCKDSAR